MANRAKRWAKEVAVLERKRQMRRLLKKSAARQPAALKELVLQCVNYGWCPGVKEAHAAELYALRKESCLFSEKYEQRKLDGRPVPGRRTWLREILAHPRIKFDRIDAYTRFVNWLAQGIPVRWIDNWKPPRSHSAEVIARSLFRHLFVRYEMPASLLRAISLSGGEDWIKCLFFHMAQGGGVHKAQGLPARWKINSKGNFFFHNAPNGLRLMDALEWAFLRQQGFSESLAMKLVMVKKKYRLEHQQWMMELKGFCERNPGLAPGKINRIIRFLLQQLHQIDIPEIKLESKEQVWIEIPPLYADFSLKGRTWESVQRHISTWDQYLKKARSLGKALQFPEPPVNGLRWESPKGHTFAIVHLSTPSHLLEEGNIMRHCVGNSYQADCIEGDSSIWSVRMMQKGRQPKRLATVEVTRHKAIDEFKGKCNTEPGDMAVRIVKIWAEAEGLALPGKLKS